MTMSTYELDDADASYLIGLLTARDTQQAVDLALRLENQLPIPVPTKIGAVVRTGDKRGPFILASPAARLPWYATATDDWISAAQLDRITEVLSEGVDL